MNTKPAPKVIRSKVSSSSGGSGRTQNLHSAKAGGVRAGKKHPADNDAGTLSTGSAARKSRKNRLA